MVHSIGSSKWFSLSLLLHVHQIGGGFFRINNAEHMTAPLELEELDPGSYDELIKYNPSLALFEDIKYGGDPNKPFDWLAPEINSQVVELVTEPDESMYKDETAKIPREIRDESDIIVEKNRDETNIFAGTNRDEIAKILKEITDETNVTLEKNRDETNVFAGINRDEISKILKEIRDETNLTAKNINETGITAEKSKRVEIVEKTRNETDIIQEKIKEKFGDKHPNLQFLVKWPVWLGNRNKTYVQENQTNVQKNYGWKNWISNATSKKLTDSRSRARIVDLNLLRARRPKFNTSNMKIRRKQVWPKTRTYRVYVPWQQRTIHDHHIYNWNLRNDTHDYYLSGTYSTSCYRCGALNYGKWWRPSVQRREENRKVIPTGKLCHEAFQGDDWRYKTKARLLRSRCYSNEPQKWTYEIGNDNYNFYHECVHAYFYPWLVNRTYDHGNTLECFGRYTGRCFKRFLDVGQVYTERGCASWPPHESNSFASHRFTKMEYLLYRKDDACVSSPLASLTPFARGVSLYLRYHVCVCKGNYCNAATHFTVRLLLLFTLCFVTLAYGSCWL